MFWTLSITLLVMWLLGMVSGYTFGGFIHLLLIVAIGLAVAAIIRTRVAASGPESTTAGGRPGEDARIDTIVRSSGTSAVAPSQAKTGRAIFLSYRRDDSADVVGRIYDRLIQRFGEAHVFKDVDAIRLGVDFREHLRTAVGECRVLIAVLGPSWVDVTDQRGRRRLEDEKDYVRIEIEAAFARGIPVIPVLVRGAALPGEDQLPGSLGPLAFRNGIAVRVDPDFHKDMDRLIAGLESLM